MVMVVDQGACSTHGCQESMLRPVVSYCLPGCPPSGSTTYRLKHSTGHSRPIGMILSILLLKFFYVYEKKYLSWFV